MFSHIVGLFARLKRLLHECLRETRLSDGEIGCTKTAVSFSVSCTCHNCDILLVLRLLANESVSVNCDASKKPQQRTFIPSLTNPNFHQMYSTLFLPLLTPQLRGHNQPLQTLRNSTRSTSPLPLLPFLRIINLTIPPFIFNKLDRSQFLSDDFDGVRVGEDCAGRAKCVERWWEETRFFTFEGVEVLLSVDLARTDVERCESCGLPAGVESVAEWDEIGEGGEGKGGESDRGGASVV